MFLAKVKYTITSTEKHDAYHAKRVFLVQPIQPDGTEKGDPWVAMDYVGCGIGDIVVCGGAPGVAQQVFGLERAPVRTLIMAIVDRIDYRDISE
ncbi:EutN/CcmL family microcompartment protein [candidate division KSB1 bacterium]|nr:EutN/CcmL family microcompartment protein [candidate division KSB1 bacterium]